MSKLEKAKEILSSLKSSSETAKRYVLLCITCNG